MESEEEEFFECRSDLTDSASDEVERPPVSTFAYPAPQDVGEPEALADGEPEKASTSVPSPYFIDEVHLKELEESLSEAEKNERREKAGELKKEGNDCFGRGEWEAGLEKYSAALRLLPPSFGSFRAILYGNRAACFIKLEDFESAVGDCTIAIQLDPTYSKALLRRGWCHEQSEETWEKALQDFQAVLKLEPRNRKAQKAVQELPPKIAVRNERLKEEMMGKMKDLGNMFLRPFGLSTEDFRMEPNPDGGYALKIQKD